MADLIKPWLKIKDLADLGYPYTRVLLIIHPMGYPYTQAFVDRAGRSIFTQSCSIEIRFRAGRDENGGLVFMFLLIFIVRLVQSDFCLKSE